MISMSLRRRLDVKTWVFTGEVARPVARTWEIAVVQLARDAPTGVTAADVCRELIAGRPRIVGERLLEVCARLGLLAEIDGTYRATEAGVLAAASGKVHVPEYGTWTLRAARDALLPHPVLEIAEAPTGASDTGESPERGGRRSPEPLPAWIREVRSREMHPVLGGGPLRIDDLGAREMGEPRSERCECWIVLELSPSSIELRVEGKIGRQEVVAHVAAPALDFTSVWRILLARNGLEHAWDAERGRLRTTFATLDDRARSTRQAILRFTAPEVPGFGAFDDVDVPGVELFPASQEDASAWSTWNLRRLVTDYAHAGRWSSWTQAAVEPFADMDPVVPSRRELARRLRISAGVQLSPEAWHVIAAEDWEL